MIWRDHYDIGNHKAHSGAAGPGAVVSGIIAALWGGWSQPMTVLCILKGMDYIWESLVDANVWEPGVYGWTESAAR